jgi:hypothetical protein
VNNSQSNYYINYSISAPPMSPQCHPWYPALADGISAMTIDGWSSCFYFFIVFRSSCDPISTTTENGHYRMTVAIANTHTHIAPNRGLVLFFLPYRFGARGDPRHSLLLLLLPLVVESGQQHESVKQVAFFFAPRGMCTRPLLAPRRLAFMFSSHSDCNALVYM